MNQQWRECIMELLPPPVSSHGVLGEEVLTAGDPPEVTLLLSELGVAVTIYGAAWVQPHELLPEAQLLAYIPWSDLPEDKLEARAVLSHLIEAARLVRQSRYRLCSRCKERVPPEWMHDETCCQSCVEEHLGVVY